MIKHPIALIIVSALAASSSCYAIGSGPYSAPNMQTLHLCPAPSELVLNKKDSTWSAHSGWEPQSPSFVTKVTTFLGAQWSGVQIGKISCIYSGLPKGTFPIAISYSKLTYDPTTSMPKKYSVGWNSRKKNVLFCYAHDRKTCPILLALRKQEGSDMDIAQGLRDQALQQQNENSGNNW